MKNGHLNCIQELNMKSKNRWRKSIKVFCLNNKGTTMLETVVSFVVLVIILAVIYQMIAYCTRLRMKATDVDNMTQAVNKAMYKDNIDESVDKVVCIPYSTDAKVLSGEDMTKGPLFYMVVDEQKTDASNGYPSSELDHRIWINDINANCFKAVDADSETSGGSANVIPTVMSFKYKKRNSE